jgi:hypothetical protein
VYNRKRSLNKKGMALVQVEAYLDRKKKYFSTKVYLKPEQWDNKKLIVKNHPNADALNRLIYEFMAMIEKKELYSREVLKYYLDHGNVFTSDYGGDKELLMSVTQLSDSIYTGGRFRRHRILIQKESLNLYSTTIFNIDIKQVPVITIFYDKAYNVKAIRNWLVYTTYKP